MVSSSLWLAKWDSDSEIELGLASLDSDSEIELGPEASDASLEVTVSDGRGDLFRSGGVSKRRRLTSGLPYLASAPHRAAASEGTLIVFDWDDTLLPSAWLQTQGLYIAVGSALPSEQQKAQLDNVARSVIKTLRWAKRLGHVMIVTNGEKGWVELSCCKFLPKVAPLLEGIKIVSARSAFGHTQPLSPIHWKRLAFRREVSAFFETLASPSDPYCRKNIASIGDSMQERTALIEATEGRDCWAKSLKLRARPSPEQLANQHELLSACLRSFVDYEGSLDLCLQIPSEFDQSQQKVVNEGLP